MPVKPGARRDLPFADGTIGDLYDRAGYAGLHVPHSWLATFSTIMNEALPAERDVIDRALGDALKRNDERERKSRRRTTAACRWRRAVPERWAEQLIIAV